MVGVTYTYMVATAHALIGGVVAASVSNPLLGVTLAAVSHPLVDVIPHWDFARGWRDKPKTKLFIESSLDVIVGVTLTTALFSQGVEPRYFAACILASIMWDFLEAPYLFLKQKRFFPKRQGVVSREEERSLLISTWPLLL